MFLMTNALHRAFRDRTYAEKGWCGGIGVLAASNKSINNYWLHDLLAL